MRLHIGIFNELFKVCSKSLKLHFTSAYSLKGLDLLQHIFTIPQIIMTYLLILLFLAMLQDCIKTLYLFLYLFWIWYTGTEIKWKNTIKYRNIYKKIQKTYTLLGTGIINLDRSEQFWWSVRDLQNIVYNVVTDLSYVSSWYQI